jgi:digeranylgeranylglycerophospholipid reductase
VRINSPVDVLVVGAGPAGLAAAEVAAAARARVVVLERAAEIGRPVRTSGASWLRDVRRLGLPAALAHPVSALRLVAPDRDACWRFARPVGCVLDVRGTYRHLADRAIRAGATLHLRHTVTAPLLEEGRVVGVELRDEHGHPAVVRSTVVLDASGPTRAIAAHQALGRKAPTGPLEEGGGAPVSLGERFTRVGLGAEYELRAPAFPTDTAILLVGRRVAPHGYAWAFPCPDAHVRVGVGLLRPPSDGLELRAALDRLLLHPALAAALEGARPVELHTGVIPAQPVARLSAAGLLLVGDAASQASPVLGEGIRYAIEAGRLAGRVAARAALAGAVSAAELATYDRAWRRRVGSARHVGWWLHRRLARYRDRNWRIAATLLAHLEPAQLAAALHDDITPSWLVAAAPRLALGLARAVVRAGVKHPSQASVY